MRPILDVAPLPADGLHAAKNHGLRLRCVCDDERHGEEHREADAVDHAERQGEAEGDAPNDHVPPQATLVLRLPGLPQRPRRLEVQQAARGLHDDGRERRLGQVPQRRREEDEAQAHDGRREDAAELRLHAAVGRQPRAAQGAAGREGAEEGAGDAREAQGDHLLRGVELVAVVQRHLLRRGVRGEKGRQGHEHTAHDETLEVVRVLDQAIEGGDVPGRPEGRQAGGDVPHGHEDGLAPRAPVRGEVAEGHAQDRHDDLLHLREALQLLVQARLGPPLLDLLVAESLELVELVQQDDQGEPKREADKVHLIDVFQRRHDVRDEAGRVGEAAETEEVPRLLHNDQDGAAGDEAAQRWVREESHGEGHLADAHQRQRHAADQRQQRGELRAVLEVGPWPQLVGNEDRRDGARGHGGVRRGAQQGVDDGGHEGAVGALDVLRRGDGRVREGLRQAHHADGHAADDVAHEVLADAVARQPLEHRQAPLDEHGHLHG
mmetsp:Transcript_109270/g.352752  ORF Transcript_109270/g.352752 Transcript_109270/m.352752 type:complete len:492 (-) Transcript_109270:198-1673(-)